MKGDFANDDFLVRRKQDVDVLFAGNGGDDFGLVWDGYQVDSWVAECDHIFLFCAYLAGIFLIFISILMVYESKQC